MMLKLGPRSGSFTDIYDFMTDWLSLLTILWFMVLIFIRLMKEIRSKWIDLVTITQYTTLLVFWVICTYQILVFQLFDMEYSILLTNVRQVLVILYFYLNLFWWALMIFHIHQVHKLVDWHHYAHFQKRVAFVEKCTASAIALILLLVSVFLGIAYPSWWSSFSEEFQLLGFIIQILISVIFIVSCIYLYVKLKRTLNNNLNHYYHMNETKILILAILNILNFLNTIVISSLVIWEVEIGSYEPSDHWTRFFIVLYLIYEWVYNLGFFFLVYFNVKNINFKLYLEVVYNGLGITQHFASASIFIKKSWWKQEYVKIDDSSNQDQGKPLHVIKQFSTCILTIYRHKYHFDFTVLWKRRNKWKSNGKKDEFILWGL